MDINMIIAFLACIILILIFGKSLVFPMKKILKIIMNSFLGAILVWLINVIGTSFGFHIGLNYITAVIVGLLGVPGGVVLVLLKIFISQ